MSVDLIKKDLVGLSLLLEGHCKNQRQTCDGLLSTGAGANVIIVLLVWGLEFVDNVSVGGLRLICVDFVVIGVFSI